MASMIAEDLWSTSGPTKKGVITFTLGDCWVLAWAIAQKLPDAKVLALGNTRDYWWSHVVVEVGEDRYLDINGVSSASKLFALWGNSQVKTFWEVEDMEDFESYKDELGIDYFSYIDNLSEAEKVAERLISVHLGVQPELFSEPLMATF